MSDKDKVAVDPNSLEAFDLDIYDDLAERLQEAALEIEVPAESLARSRAAFIEAIDASRVTQRTWWRRGAAFIAASLVLGILGGTAYASSKAEPGSALWTLRAAGWNLELSFTSADRQADALAQQADQAADLALDKASRCDSKGTETARREAVERVRRAREKIEQKQNTSDSNAVVVLAGVEAKLGQLPPPGGPVCDALGRRLPGAAARKGSNGKPDSQGLDKSDQTLDNSGEKSKSRGGEGATDLSSDRGGSGQVESGKEVPPG